MKRFFCLILSLLFCLLLIACNSTTSSQMGSRADEEVSEAAVSEAFSVPADVPMYAPGVCVPTSFGEITVLDAAFCTKAQLVDALPRPAYNSAGDGRVVFAMRVQITNTSDIDLVLFDDLKVSIIYGEENSFGCSKGGNYKSSDPLYKYLPAGSSGEYIICGRVPVEVYQANQQFCVSFQDSMLGFAYDQVHIYNVMGYREGDNVLTSRESVIASAGTAPAEVPTEAEAAVDSEIAFALEDVRCSVSSDGWTVEVKIRNNSSISMPGIVFNGVILDSNGDILENCFCVYQNGLEAGQGGWESLRITDPATLEAMDSIKFITVWYKLDPQAPSHNQRFDLPAPFVIDFKAQ